MSDYDAVDLDRLEPAYLGRYGLIEAPFAPAHDDRYFYLDAERAQRLDMLQHLCQYSQLLLMVTGPAGVGKTSLMRRFISNADQDWRICQLDATPMMDADQLLRHIATGFGLHPLPDDPAQVHAALYDHMVSLQRRNLVPILVVDDAHDLPEDALETLFQLADTESGDGHLLRIILFCEPQIERILDSRALRGVRDRITHTLDVPPLGEEQVAEYLRHRLHVAGFRGDESPFSPRAIKRIARTSEGIPARINRLAHTLLRDGKVDESAAESTETDNTAYTVSGFMDARHARRAVPILIIGILAGIGLAYQDDINRFFAEDTPPTSDAIPGTTPATAPAAEVEVTGDPPATTRPTAVAEAEPATGTPAASPQTITIPVTPPPAAEPATPAGPPAAPTTPPTAAPATPASETPADAPPPLIPGNTPSLAPKGTPVAPAATPAPAPKPAAPATLAPLRVDSIAPSPVVGSPRQQVLKLRGNGFVKGIQLEVAWAGKRKRLPAARVTRLNGHELTFRITTGIKPDDWTVTVIRPADNARASLRFRVRAPAAAPSPARPPAPASGPRDAAWWLQQDPGRFTIQLFISRLESGARDFVRRHKLGDTAGIVRTRKNGEPRFTVLYGLYPNRAAAQQAVSRLSPALRKLKPWIRVVKGVQAQLRASGAATAGTPVPGGDVTPPPANLPAPGHTTGGPPRDPAQAAGWIWSQDPQHFTLQLLGSRQEASVRQFVRDHHLEGKATWFRSRQNGRDWYAVIYGVYPDRASALAARNALPAALRRQSPWARSFASIHSELEAAP